jgi:uncharacterized protein
MRARRYVSWLSRRSKAILAASALLVATSLYLAAFHLPLDSDFSALLPAKAPAVRAAAQLASRMPARDRMLLIVQAPDPATRAAAAQLASDGLAAIPRTLVEHVEPGDREAHEFIRANQHLYLPLADLEHLRGVLAGELEAARLRANPLYIDLGDGDSADEAAGRDLDELRARHRAAATQPGRDVLISDDGRMQVFVIHTAFRATDVARDKQLMRQLEALAAQIGAIQPAATIGFAGGPAVTVAEHRALSRGVLLSSLITALLVSLVLWLHLRSLRLLALIAVNIVAGTAVSFGVATLTVGHLNAATAFLGAIIAGNGVNYGILLVARWREERRKADAEDAMATAIRGTLMPTLVASLGAAIAYGALGATTFRGFADFALIGGIGMLVCWIASFVLLPVLVLRWLRAPLRSGPDLFGRLVVRVFAFRRPALVCALAVAVTAGACVISWRYLADDPYEYDLTQLRSQARDARTAREWLALADETFGRGLAGIASQTFVAVNDPAAVDRVVADLQAIAAREPVVGSVRSIRDLVPADQDAKLAVLADIRAQLDAIVEVIDDPGARDELLAVRPPETLAAIDLTSLPATFRAKLAERDGRIGLVIEVKPGRELDERDGRDLIRFAAALRQLDRDAGQEDDVIVTGAALLFADVLLQIQKDGPRVTAIAGLGLVVMVLLVVGRTRRALAVLVATGSGSILMVAVCALAGIKINFLDFVALPITLGLGIDYAINIADRATHADPLVALRSTGGTVLVCSLTTVIGYLSLFASDNLSIRGFGLASLIGELTCMVAAFVIVPALIALPQLSRGLGDFGSGADPASSRA